MIELQYLWLVGPLVAMGAFTQGFTGLGFGIVILAGIAFIPWDFERSTVVVNLLVLVLHTSLIWDSRREARIQWHLVGLILVGLTLGVPLGYWFILVFGNQPAFQLVFGASLAAFAANELIKLRIKALPRWMGLPAGTLGGFLGGAFTTSGPPIAIFLYSQHKDPALLKGTLQLVFMVATLWRLVNIILFGPGITGPVLKVSALSLMIVPVFSFLGHRLSRRVASRVFLRSVYSLIAAAGMANVLRALL